jgi:hypothetical protein
LAWRRRKERRGEERRGGGEGSMSAESRTKERGLDGPAVKTATAEEARAGVYELSSPLYRRSRGVVLIAAVAA